MTRRIATSILLTVWLALFLAAGLAYFVTRSMLIADLDATLLARVSSLPEIERPTSLANVAADARDRFVIQNPDGQIERPPAPGPDAKTDEIITPRIIAASFNTLADSSRIRTITVKAYAKRPLPTDPLVPVTVVYSGPADRLDKILERLILSLGTFGLLAGIATAAVAVAVAKAALRPLRAAAQVIGDINETNLDRRIAVHQLPSELAPVGLKLNDLLARLETAFAQRKQFLADASHELRTPVAALVTTLEVTLAKSRPAEDYQRTLKACLADARLLHQLVQALMDQVRSEQFAGEKSALDVAPVQLTSILQHCGRIAAALAQLKNIELSTSIPEDVVALTDELKIRSIVTNLLSNAVEYTPNAGKVTLSLEILEHPAASRWRPLPAGIQAAAKRLRITVEDTGPGIPTEHLPHLFEPFYRADEARSNPESHLGLGLFLVRGHCLILGGDCRVESGAGSGARFIVELPAALLQPEPPPTHPSTSLHETAIEEAHA